MDFYDLHTMVQFWSILVHACASVNACMSMFVRTCMWVSERAGGWVGVDDLAVLLPPAALYVQSHCRDKTVWAQNFDKFKALFDDPLVIVQCTVGWHVQDRSGSTHSRSVHGLWKGHAYSVLRIHVASDGQAFVRVRNPWGPEAEWLGPYSNKWPDWHDAPVYRYRSATGRTGAPAIPSSGRAPCYLVLWKDACGTQLASKCRSEEAHVRHKALQVSGSCAPRRPRRRGWGGAIRTAGLTIARAAVSVCAGGGLVENRVETRLIDWRSPHQC